jgi:hypothetical protein
MTIILIALAACVAGPALVCRSIPPAQNMSRAPRPQLRKQRGDQLTDANGLGTSFHGGSSHR